MLNSAERPNLTGYPFTYVKIYTRLQTKNVKIKTRFKSKC